jgi:alginate O-acetyltransferase complex protein AlgI
VLFNSLQFLLFFPIVTLGFFFLPHRFRWLWLLIASCYFYMAFIPYYILILGFTIVVDYFAGIAIERCEGAKRKLFLTASLIANIGILAVFKYYNFFVENVNLALGEFGLSPGLKFLQIVLPIGLSFHTFQAMSYTIEVYRGKFKAERNFGIYSLYVMFYPQLVAGPIERPQNVLPQFYKKHDFNYDRVVDGLRQMLLGFFKKIVIADNLAEYVNLVYDNPADHSGTTIIVATLLFSYQIYCDFSGYTDIALGAARVMGFDLMVNFNRPYSSRSIKEFWSRWHISLSTWFRDYLYIPLGGNKVSKGRRYFNLFFVFLISGFWHGANWTYIVWGALHGFFLVFAILTEKQRERINDLTGLNSVPRIKSFIQLLITLSLVSFAWLFFRAESMSDALLLIRNSVRPGDFSFSELKSIVGIYPFLAILFLELIQWWESKTGPVSAQLATKPAAIRWSAYAVVLFMIFLFGQYHSTGEFIYFQF